MKGIFELRSVREQYELNLNIPRKKQVAFGNKSLESLVSKIWNNVPYHIKFTEDLNIFKDHITKWNDSSCSCNVSALKTFLSTILFHR